MDLIADRIMVIGLRIIMIGLAFGLTVFVHEAGHFVSARLAGMAVYEFSIGFGRPLLFWFKRKDTQYSFRLWPFFSYVRIAGMEPGDDHTQGFTKKSRPIQAMVLITGCLMNLLLGALIFILMGVFLGSPVATNTVKEVLKDTPAMRAGLHVGDRIIGVDSRIGLSLHEIQEAIQSHPEKPLELHIERGGTRLTLVVVPKKEKAYDLHGIRLVQVPIGRIGIIFDSRIERLGVGKSIVAGFVGTYEMVRLQIAALVGMVTKTMPVDVMGPVGVVHALYSEAKADLVRFLGVAAALTVGVGFLNLMPIPPLDGSRLLIVGLEAIRRKPFDKKKELVVHLIGFAILIGLMLILTYKDIVRIVEAGGG